MQRHQLAAFASSLFAGYWAALQWPWVRHADDATAPPWAGLALSAGCVLLAVALWKRKAWARVAGLALAVSVIALFFVALPLAFGASQFSCDGRGFRCYFEFFGATSCAVVLFAASLRPFASNSVFKS
jgi:hypothetical protein